MLCCLCIGALLRIGYCDDVYIDHLPLYANYINEWGAYDNNYGQDCPSRVFEIEAIFSTTLQYTGSLGMTFPLPGRKVSFNVFKQYTGAALEGYGYQYLWGSQAKIYPTPANGKTDKDGKISWRISYGDHTRAYLPYWPNGVYNFGDWPEVIALPEIPKVKQFAAASCGAFYEICPTSIVYAPAYLCLWLRWDGNCFGGCAGQLPYSGAGVGYMPEYFIDRYGLDTTPGILTPSSESVLLDSSSFLEYCHDSNEVVIDSNVHIPSQTLLKPQEYGIHFGNEEESLRILYEDKLQETNCDIMFKHDFAVVDNPQDMNNYLETNYPYAYLRTIGYSPATNFKPRYFTAVLYVNDVNGVVLYKTPINMNYRDTPSSAKLRFVSDYIYAVTDFKSAGKKYDNSGNAFVCVPMPNNSTLTIGQPFYQNGWDCYDFNGDGKRNFQDFAIFAKQWKRTVSDPNFDYGLQDGWYLDYKIDMRDLRTYTKYYWLGNYDSPGDFNKDRKINLLDYRMFCDMIGSCNPLYDLNRDGKVDIKDLKQFRENYLIY